MPFQGAYAKYVILKHLISLSGFNFYARATFEHGDEQDLTTEDPTNDSIASCQTFMPSISIE
jgi:hypothetical protein